MTPTPTDALAAQGTVVADQSNATSVTVRTSINGLPTQTRQGLQAELDSAVQQTGRRVGTGQLAAGSTPLGSVATEFAAVFADRAQAMTQLRAAVYGYLGMQPIAAGAPPAGDGRRRAPAPRLPLGHPGHEPHRRSGRTPGAFRRPLPLGPAVARRRCRTRTAPPVGLGDRPAGVAARQCGRPGRSSGHLAHAGGDALRRPAHRAPEPPRPARRRQAPRRTCRCSVPTSQIGVTVVLANQGSSNEPHVSVRFSLADQASGATTSQVRTDVTSPWPPR